MRLSSITCLLLAFCLASTTGCHRKVDVDRTVNPPISERSSDNSHVPVSHLVTIEGCKVYRFTDAAAYRYVAICPHSASVESDDDEHCGKRCRKTTTDSTHMFFRGAGT